MCLLFSQTLHLLNLSTLIIGDCQFYWPATDKPTLKCTKTINVTMKFNIAFNLPPLIKLFSANHLIPLFNFQKPVFLCLFLLDDKGFAV